MKRMGEFVDLQSFLCGFGHFLRNMPNEAGAGIAADQMCMTMQKAKRFLEIVEDLALPVSCMNARKLVTALERVPVMPDGRGHVAAGQIKYDLIGPLDFIVNHVGNELSTKVFIGIPANKIRYFENADLFGQSVADAFPSAAYDIEEAGRCFAMARYTATVFHLMRALEPSLNVLARDLGVTTASNWN